MTFTETGFLTWGVGILSYAIPMLVFVYAVLTTRRVPVACVRCDADVPPTARNCPNCGAIAANQDQPL